MKEVLTESNAPVGFFGPKKCILLTIMLVLAGLFLVALVLFILGYSSYSSVYDDKQVVELLLAVKQTELDEAKVKLNSATQTLNASKESLTSMICSSKLYGTLTPSGGSISALIHAHDGSYLAIYRTNSNTFVVKTDSSAKQVWATPLDCMSALDRIIETTNKNIIVAVSGYAVKGTNSTIALLSPDGQITWKIVDGGYVQNLIEDTPDSPVMVINYANSDTHLLKLDNLGKMSFNTSLGKFFVTSVYRAPLLKLADGYLVGGSDKVDTETSVKHTFHTVQLDNKGEITRNVEVNNCEWAEGLTLSPAGNYLTFSLCWVIGDFTWMYATIMEYDNDNHVFKSKYNMSAGQYDYSHGTHYITSMGNGLYAISINLDDSKGAIVYDYNTNTVLRGMYSNLYDKAYYQMVAGSNGEVALLTDTLEVLTAQDRRWSVAMGGSTAGIIGEATSSGYVIGYGDEILRVFPWADKYAFKNC